MRRYLVIANQTLVSDSLVDKIAELIDEGPSQFHIVVPATRQQDRLTWTSGKAWAVARRRLDSAIAAFQRLAAPVSGQVGDENPVLAAMDALRTHQVDEVILCTLPAGMSTWLRKDLPTRLRRRINLPVQHLVLAREATVDLTTHAPVMERLAA